MLARLAIVFVVVLGASAGAAREFLVHATCAADVPHGPAHTRSMHGQLMRALGRIPASRGYTLDVALVRLATTELGSELEVHAELRGLLSDPRGRVRLTSVASARARGARRHVEHLQRDAVTEATQQLSTRLRAQWHSAARAGKPRRR